MTAFTPHKTLFKLPHRRATFLLPTLGLDPDSAWVPVAKTVECLGCQSRYPLRDLLKHELEETGPCPKCGLTASVYWADK